MTNMAVKNDTSKDQAEAQDLAELKKIADDLGLEYSDRIGYETLEKRIREAKKEKETAKKTKPQTVTPEQVKIMKAKNLKKVKITNMDPNNAGQTTVFAGVHNMHMDLARVIPLDMEIALEQALIDNIKQRRTVTAVPHVVNGKDTGNTVAKEINMYAIEYL